MRHRETATNVRLTAAMQLLRMMPVVSVYETKNSPIKSKKTACPELCACNENENLSFSIFQKKVKRVNAPQYRTFRWHWQRPAPWEAHFHQYFAANFGVQPYNYRIRYGRHTHCLSGQYPSLKQIKQLLIVSDKAPRQTGHAPGT